MAVFRHVNVEHAVIEGGVNLTGVCGVWQLERALELAVGAFHAVVVAAVSLLLELTLAGNREHSPVEADLDFFLLHARQGGFNVIAFLGLERVDFC